MNISLHFDTLISIRKRLSALFGEHRKVGRRYLINNIKNKVLKHKLVSSFKKNEERETYLEYSLRVRNKKKEEETFQM